MSDLIKIFIVGIYLFLLYKYYKNSTLLLLFTLATILILCNINKVTEGNWVEQYAKPDFGSVNNIDETDIYHKSTNNVNKNNNNANKNNNKNNNSNNNSKNNSNNSNKNNNNNTNEIKGIDNLIIPVSPLNFQMGPYDQLVLTTGNPKSEYVRLRNAPLSTKEEVCVYQGHENPLKCQKTTGLNMGPSVDGTPGAPKSLFPFTFNRSSPDCCPSTFSTSSGCVCTTENQRQFINRRGLGS